MVEDLDALLNNGRRFGKFIKDGLNIEDNLELSVIDIPFAKIYTKDRGSIYLSKPLGEVFYYIIKLDGLKELREGVKFLINHEVGHFHDNDYLGNERLEDYFSSIKQLYRAQFGGDVLSFPDSEATRYALSKSANFKEALAGTAAVLSFINGDDPNLEIELLERHYSSSKHQDNYRVNKTLSKLTDFKLSASLKGQINSKAEEYLKKLENSLKVRLAIISD